MMAKQLVAQRRMVSSRASQTISVFVLISRLLTGVEGEEEVGKMDMRHPLFSLHGLRTDQSIVKTLCVN